MHRARPKRPGRPKAEVGVLGEGQWALTQLEIWRRAISSPPAGSGRRSGGYRVFLHLFFSVIYFIYKIYKFIYKIGFILQKNLWLPRGWSSLAGSVSGQWQGSIIIYYVLTSSIVNVCILFRFRNIATYCWKKNPDFFIINLYLTFSDFYTTIGMRNWNNSYCAVKMFDVGLGLVVLTA